ncbi:Tyrosine-protein kinase receptor, partial [Operophtera brumata]
MFQDMPASNNTLFYIFQNLAPAREYEVAVTMRNAIGEGPRALVRVSTPPLPTSIPSQQPVLILGGEHNVLAAPANDMLSDPVELYSTEHIITGTGFVYRSALSKKSASEPILTPENILYKPLDLSVDWLNHHLYVLGEVYYSKEAANRQSMTPYPNWEIIRCDFGGKNQIVALSGFNSRPIHFEVDAYNGREVTDFRSNTQTPMFLSTHYIAYANGLFYWTNGKEMLTEEYHEQSDSYFHNEYPLAYNTKVIEARQVLVALSIIDCGLFYWTNGKEMLTEEYHEQSDSYFHNEYPLAYNTKVIEARQVLVALSIIDCGLFYWTNGKEMLTEEYHEQSDRYFHNEYPLAYNTKVIEARQSVMGINVAKVSWSPPHLLGHQGSGAWQQWTFHLQLTHAGSGDVTDIEPKARCRIQFVGKTLESSPTTLHSTLLWSGPDGLLQTDLTGDNLHTLIHRSHMKNFHITDISWYRDKLYLVTNASTVMWYNTTTHERGLMHNMDNVGSMAVDWITRGNFDGSNREPVPIVTVAKELSIDSLGAYIYWNTGHAVEAARLNGENKMVYYPAQLFSGKQAWSTVSSHGLYSLPTATANCEAGSCFS